MFSIPAWAVAVIWLLVGVSSTYNSFQTRGVLQKGLFLIAIASSYFSGVYFYFTTFVVDVDIRQLWVRGGLVWVGVVLLYWQYKIFRGQ